MPGPSERKLEIVQVLRAAAVLCVVVSHAFHALAAMLAGRQFQFDEKVFPGDFGVDLFFVISGFIMVYTCWDQYGRKGQAAGFLVRRAIRILPLYWTMTSVMIAVIILMPESVRTASPEPLHWLQSYLLIPFERPGDGLIRPVLGLGWSLQYEMYFYLLFAISLLLPRRAGLVAIVVMLISITGLAAMQATAGGNGVAVRFLGSGIVLEFAAGVLIGYFYMKGVRLERWLAIALALAGIALLFMVPAFDEMVARYRHIHYGIPALLLVAAAVFGRGNDTSRFNRFAVAAGDASYATYLTHPFIVGAAAAGFGMLDLDRSLGPMALVISYTAVVLAASVLAGHFTHHLFDKPVTAYLRRRLTENSGRHDARR